MAFTITAYTFSKRENSTKQPTGLSGTDYSVVLKDRTSYENPVFLLHSDDVLTFNYIQWGSWYYFVDDIIIERDDLYSIVCSLDVLATYKTDIAATSAFVLYDTAANTELRDTRLALKDTAKYSSYTYTSTLFGDNYTCVILTVVSQRKSRAYVVLPSTVDSLMTKVQTWFLDENNPNKLEYTTIDPDDVDPEDPDSIFEIIANLGKNLKALVNNITAAARQKFSTNSAPDCIRSAILLPMRGTAFSVLNSEEIYLGEYDTDLSGQPLQFDAHAEETITLTIPWQYNDWRNGSMCTEVCVFLPYCGVIPLSADALRGATSIVILTRVSTDGSINYILTATDSGLHTAYIGTFKGSCGSPYRVGINQESAQNTIGGIVSGIGALAGMAAAGIGTLAGIGIGAAGLMGMAHGMQPIVSMAGSIGGSAYTSPSHYGCYCITHDTAAEPVTLTAAIGTPTMSVKQIGTLSGYVQTACASVSATAETPVLQKINDFLNGGFFYE